METEMSSFEEFPASELSPEGIKIIKADRSPKFAMPKLHVKYAEKDKMPLHLQIILPPMECEDMMGKEKKFPLVVFIQGSAWLEQNLGEKIHGLCEFATRGYVVAIVEYRPSYVAPFPAQVKDAKTAIRFLQENADDYHIDRDNIFVWGDSSGGHTCVMVAATMEREYNDEKGKLNVKAFIDFYGPVDITKMNDQNSTQDHMSPESPEGRLIGKRPVDNSPEWTDAVNPMNHISRDQEIRPILIVHGDKDCVVPFRQSVLLYEKLKKLDKKVELYKLEGADHGGDAFLKKSVLDLVEQFLKKNM
ncbi:MAG: alpha/beta hydrolase [Hespellia sp.]|nr:alpha/beta hydrolase [Hespellia sp.]